MIRISDNVWIKRDQVISLSVIDNQVVLFLKNDSLFQIGNRYLTDALTGLNVNVGDVLAQLGRSEHEANS